MRIDNLLWQNHFIENYVNSEMSYEWKTFLEEKAKTNEEYIENLKDLKNSGMEILRIKHNNTYYNGVTYVSGYDLEIEYNNEKYEVSVYLETKGKRILITGLGYSTPTRFQNEYTIEDLKYQDYIFYKKIEKMLIY